MQRFLAFIFVLAFLTNANALQIGNYNLLSKQNSPLSMEVELFLAKEDKVSSLKPAIASKADYESAGLQRLPIHDDIQLKLNQSNKQFFVKLSSKNPVEDSYLDILLEVTSEKGRTLREFTVLLDPADSTKAPEPKVQKKEIKVAEAEPEKEAVRAEPLKKEVVDEPKTKSVTSKRGKTLFQIARENSISGVTTHQMVVAIFQINPKAFAKNNINGLEVGQKLTLPTRPYFDKLSHLQAREILKEQNLEWKNLNQKTTKIAEKKKPKAESKKNDVDKLKKEPELKNNAAEKAKADTAKEVEAPQPNENIIEDKVNNEIVEIEEEDFTSSIIDDEKPIIEEVIIDDPIEEPGNNKLIYVLLTIFALLGGVLVYLSKKRANFRKSPNPSFASQSFSSTSDAQNLSDDFTDQNDAFINSTSNGNETQLNENINQEVSESIETSSNSDVDLSTMTSVDAYIYKKNKNIN